MKQKLLNEEPAGLRTFALIYDAGDEVMSLLESFARAQRITGAHFVAIGAFSDVVLAYFDWDTKQYEKIPVREQVEVLTLAGDIALKQDGEPAVHAHVVIGKRDASAHGGHLLEARVRPTLELIMHETPQHLRKRHDLRSGLSLIDPSV